MEASWIGQTRVAFGAHPSSCVKNHLSAGGTSGNPQVARPTEAGHWARCSNADEADVFSRPLSRLLVNGRIVTYLLHMMHVLDALGNPLRRAILQELRGGPLSVGDIAARLPVSRPAVSRHLRVLEDAGLVQAREEGTRNIYSVHMQGFASVRAFVDAFWDTALARLEELARR